MPALINHIAIISENYATSGKFYESVFGLVTSARTRPSRGLTVGDGYAGLNINPRKAGRPARLDHFGIQVTEIEAVLERLRAFTPAVETLVRPSTRPYAAISTHDPDGNIFDLSQRSSPNRAGLYAEDVPLQPRRIDHLALRTLHPDLVTAFYRDVFELSETPAAPGDRNRYLSDGRVTLVIIPWHIGDYAGTGIAVPGPDHLGFAVESLAALAADVARVAGNNPRLTPFPYGVGDEGAARLALAQRSCARCEYHLTDVDGVVLSAREVA